VNTTDEKKRAFDEGMLVIAEAFDKTLSPELAEIYWRSMEEYTAEQIKNAFAQAVLELKFFPRPAHLREFILGSPETTRAKGHFAALEVIDAIKRWGASQTVQFKDGHINAIIVQIYSGWIELCKMEIKDTKWFLKDFQEYYFNFVQKGREIHEPLIGYNEQSNVTAGIYVAGVIIMIGEEEDPRKLLT
jgi:hypothetical protein